MVLARAGHAVCRGVLRGGKWGFRQHRHVGRRSKRTP
jgi:hypothetical protein